MSRLQIKSTITLPQSASLFNDVTPAIQTKLQEYIDAGTLFSTPRVNTTNDDGTKTIVITSIWQDQTTYDEYRSYLTDNYLAINSEWHSKYSINIEVESTEVE